MPRQLAKLNVDLLRIEILAVDLGALVEVNVRRIRIAKTNILFGDIEESLLRPAGETFGMHAHLMAEMVLLRSCYARHTRTSSS
ncbi:MAG: hypothetical protein KJZ78_29995 [Bryobacteraceae bacterium]|nr:hypothetical protein [Bryobacteraceae bacterium]